MSSTTNISSGVPMQEIRKLAEEMLPQPYSPIDDEFIETHKETIDLIKSDLDPYGGLHKIEIDDELAVLARVPSREILLSYGKRVKANKSANDDQSFEADFSLVSMCLVYPKAEVVREWTIRAPGAISTIGLGILEIAKLNREPVVKKL